MKNKTGYRPAVLLVLMLVLGLGQARAQHFSWLRQFGDSNEAHITAVLPQSDGSIIVAGYYRDHLKLDAITLKSPQDNGNRISSFMAKITQDSNVRWAKNMLDGAIIKDVKQDAKGNFYIAGMLISSISVADTTLIPYGPYTSFLLKCSAAQVPEWVNYGALLYDADAPVSILFNNNLDVYLWEDYKEAIYPGQNTFSDGVCCLFYNRDRGDTIVSKAVLGPHYRLRKAIGRNNIAYAVCSLTDSSFQHPMLSINKYEVVSPLMKLLVTDADSIKVEDARLDEGGNVYVAALAADSVEVNSTYYSLPKNRLSGFVLCTNEDFIFKWINSSKKTAGADRIMLDYNARENKMGMVTTHYGPFDWGDTSISFADTGYIYNNLNLTSGKLEGKPVELAHQAIPISSSMPLVAENDSQLFFIMNYSGVSSSDAIGIGGHQVYNAQPFGTPVPAFMISWYTTAKQDPFNTSITRAMTLDKNFTIYPNPANDYVSIECEDGSEEALYITISDIHGAMLKQSVLSVSSRPILDISSLAQGIYTISIRNSKGLSVSRLIKI